MIISRILPSFYFFLFLINSLFHFSIYSLFIDETFFILIHLIYSFYIIIFLFNLPKENLFYNPLFLITIKVFLLGYGITIFYIYLDDNIFNNFGTHNPYYILTLCNILAFISFLIFMLSYNSYIIIKFANTLSNYFSKKRYVLEKFNLNYKLLIILFLVSIIFKLILIKLGIYGVLNTIFDKNININYVNYVMYLSQMSYVIVFLFSLDYYIYSNKKRLFYFIFIISIYFSILTGYKGEIILNFVILFFASI